MKGQNVQSDKKISVVICTLSIVIFHFVISLADFFLRSVKHIAFISRMNILSRASGVGSPTNHRAPGSDKTRGQGSFGLFTGGPSDNYPTKIFKKKNGLYNGPVLLRQGEPGTSQYVQN